MTQRYLTPTNLVGEDQGPSQLSNLDSRSSSFELDLASVEFRLLRYFIAMAEELHLGRAAERLGIEQSPLSRAVRELERLMNVQLLDRTTRNIRLTSAGQVLLSNGRQVLAKLNQTVCATLGAAQGYQSVLRISFCDGAVASPIAGLLARCREDEPELQIRASELSFTQQSRDLREGLIDVGFSQSATVNGGLVAEKIWSEPLMLIFPARHPLLAYSEVSLDDALKFPLVLLHREAVSGCHDQIHSVIERTKAHLKIVDRVKSTSELLTLVACGFGIGFATAAQLGSRSRKDIVSRRIAGAPPVLATYLIRRSSDPPEPISRFLKRARHYFGKSELALESACRLIDPSTQSCKYRRTAPISGSAESGRGYPV